MKNKVIFIDRDGTINKKMPRGEYVRNWSEFEFIPGVLNFLTEFSNLGFSFIVITNQAGVARGVVDIDSLKFIHDNLTHVCLQRGINLLQVYVCTHHWNDGCSCRKPRPGMFFRAAVDYNVDLGSSVYIGDDVRDMEAARNAGLQGVFVGNSDASLGDLCVPTFHNLMASSDFLKNFYRDNK